MPSRFVPDALLRIPGPLAKRAELAAGTLAQLARGFFGSTEFKAGGRFVAALYIAMLQRDAEYRGWQFQRLHLAENQRGFVRRIYRVPALASLLMRDSSAEERFRRMAQVQSPGALDGIIESC